MLDRAGASLSGQQSAGQVQACLELGMVRLTDAKNRYSKLSVDNDSNSLAVLCLAAK